MFSNCNAKWRVCCTHLYTKPTITSSVYGRQFSIINNYVFNLTSSDLVYFILIVACNILGSLFDPERLDLMSTLLR